jgi:hypothetical protein
MQLDFQEPAVRGSRLPLLPTIQPHGVDDRNQPIADPQTDAVIWVPQYTGQTTRPHWHNRQPWKPQAAAQVCAQPE